MKLSKLLLPILIFSVLAATSTRAQNGSITGVAKNAKTGEKLPGARVELIEKGLAEKEATGKKYGDITGKNGEFTIKNIPPGKYIVVAHFIGFKNYYKDINVKPGERKMEVKLMPDVVSLDEVIVTGVASKRAKAVADVSVARINASELRKQNVYQDFSQMVAGKVSGVQVKSASGNVGGGIRFHIRGGGGLNGDGQPVIYVDGIRMNNNEIGIDISGQGFSTLADLNPNDIKSVEILKGPAGAALYGTSGSNGVVLITTKHGKRAEDYTEVNYQSVFGWNEQAVEYSEDDFVSAKDANAIFREGALHENTINFQGKSGMFSYYGAYTNRDEDGIVGNNSYERESVRGNFEVFPNEQLNLKVSGNYVWSDNNRPINDNNVMGWLGNTMLFTQSYRFTDSTAISKIQNGVVTKRFIGSAQLSYTPNWLPGLRLHGVVGFDGMNYRNDAFYPPGYFYTGPSTKGEKEIFQRTRDQINYDFHAAYDFEIIEDLKSTSYIGAQIFENYTRFSDVTLQDFASPKISNLDAGAEYIAANDGLLHYKEAGLFVEEDLNYKDTYIMTLSVRNDYTSVLGNDAPSIFYPSVRGAVRLDKFDFLPDQINFLKLRAGYGQSGQLPGILAAYPLRWAGQQSGHGVGGLINSIGNSDIEPERLEEFEMGIETQFFNAYGFDLTYFQGYGKNSIINLPNPPSTGLTASDVPTNIAEIRSWGVEARFYANPIITEQYKLNFDANVTWSDNEIIELGTDQPIIGGFGNQGWYEGERRSAFIAKKVLGAQFDEETGQFLGPKVSDEEEYLGTPIPILNGSFSTNFTFLKNFTVYCLFEWATGHSMYNNTRAFQVSFGNNVEYNELNEELGTLDPGTAEYRATAEKIARLNPNYDDNFIEEADWLRLREISLRIDVTDWMSDYLTGSHIKNLSFVASVRNAALWTKYSGADPEVNMFGARTNIARGVDFLTLQNARTYNFQVNLGL